MTLTRLAKSAAKMILPQFRSRLVARRILYYPLDMVEYAAGLRSPITPPRGLWYVGGEDGFQSINDEFLGYFQRLGGLRPDHRILDVGCGVGVMASRLTAFMNSRGSYLGFDVVEPGIRWCQKHITSRYPNFAFRFADVFHEQYNPKGKTQLLDLSFPAKDGEFDFIWLKSVFTHMVPMHIRHYLAEIHRSLANSGRCLATFFLLNDESKALIKGGASTVDISHCVGDYSVMSPRLPELAIGIPETNLTQWCDQLGIEVEHCRYGSWCGRESYTSYQDIVVLRRRAAVS